MFILLTLIYKRQVNRLIESLELIQNQGVVCAEFETCKHVSCTSSYTSWVVADAMLKEGVLLKNLLIDKRKLE